MIKITEIWLLRSNEQCKEFPLNYNILSCGPCTCVMCVSWQVEGMEIGTNPLNQIMFSVQFSTTKMNKTRKSFLTTNSNEWKEGNAPDLLLLECFFPSAKGSKLSSLMCLQGGAICLVRERCCRIFSARKYWLRISRVGNQWLPRCCCVTALISLSQYGQWWVPMGVMVEQNQEGTKLSSFGIHLVLAVQVFSAEVWLKKNGKCSLECTKCSSEVEYCS